MIEAEVFAAYEGELTLGESLSVARSGHSAVAIQYQVVEDGKRLIGLVTVVEQGFGTYGPSYIAGCGS